MRCESCHAHLSIDDERCPYCGTPNPEAVKHRQDMQKFSGEFQETRSSVLRTTNENAKKSVRIVIICVMVVLTIFSMIFLGGSWNIASSINEWQATANFDTYCAILDQYEEEGDFLSFVEFYDQNSLYLLDAYDEYRYVYWAASDYRRIYGELLALMEEELWEGDHDDAFKYLCSNLDSYYRHIALEPYGLYEADAYKEVHLDAVQRMTEKIENLIQLTFSIPEEDMVGFRSLSNAEKQVFLERRFASNE